MLHVLLLSVSCCFCPSCLFRGKKRTSLSSSYVCTDLVSKADSNRFWYIFVNAWLGCYFFCIIFQHFMQRFAFWVGLRGVAFSTCMTLSLISSSHTAFLTAYLNFAFELTLWMWQSESEAAIEAIETISQPPFCCCPKRPSHRGIKAFSCGAIVRNLIFLLSSCWADLNLCFHQEKK